MKREVLVKEKSVRLRLSALAGNLKRGKFNESHFVIELKSAVFGQTREMKLPYFSLIRDSLQV